MANSDSTRPGFDLSPWLGRDPLSIFQAAWLWAGISPTLPTSPENEARYCRELAAARDWFDRLEGAAKAGELHYEKPLLLVRGALIERGSSNFITGERRPARYEMVQNWRGARVALADLRAFAESIGQRPGFLFAETAGQQSAVANGVDLTGRVKARAAEIAKERSAGNEYRPSMAVIAKALETEAATKIKAGSEDAMYKGGKGAHTVSWYKSKLKGWQPEK